MRTRTPFYLKKSGLLATLIAAAFSPYAFALTPAGKIDFAFGKVTATGADGASRPLTKGAEVYSGDAIVTTDGRVQIRFSDGAYMALQPNTVFKVDQYAFEGKSDGKEKGSFSLVKGGLRTISGIIGKVNKQNYEIRTPTATIGIRGTAYSANQSDDGLVVSVASGLVSVSNQGGNVTLSSGQSVLVRTPTSAPQMTDQKAAADQIVSDSKKQQEKEEQTQAERPLDTQNPNAVGDQRAPNGASLPVANNLLPANGPGYAIAEAYGNGYGNLYSYQDANATFSGKALVSYVPGGESSAYSYEGTVAEANWDGIIGWGRWVGNGSSGGNEAFNVLSESSDFHQHYVVGKPTSDVAIAALNGTTVNYALIGATSVATLDYGSSGSGSNSVSLGTFTGSAAVHFGATASMDLNVNIADSTKGNLSGSFNGMQLQSQTGGSIATFNTSGTTTVTGSAVSSGSVSASINLNGLFAGPNADRLGIAYRIDQGNLTHTGAAAFTAPTPR